MSGAFDLEKNGGWVVFEPQHISSKFDKYDSLLCVIVVYGKGKHRHARMHLPEETMKKLGQPKFVRVMRRGTNIGLIAVPEKDRAYNVMRTKTENNKPFGRAFLNLTAFFKEQPLREGVYDANMNGGVLVIDTLQEPSKI